MAQKSGSRARKNISTQKTAAEPPKKKIVVGLSGASGAIFCVRLLDMLHDVNVESHLVITASGEETLRYETGLTSQVLKKRATKSYDATNMAAAISSGSFPTDGMVVAPCSMRSLAEIATGVTSNLLTRAADVTLKERRRLILMVRESPLHSGHLQNMLKVSELGGIIAPPLPAFYAKPKSLDDIVEHALVRVLDLLGLSYDGARRWGDNLGPNTSGQKK